MKKTEAAATPPASAPLSRDHTETFTPPGSKRSYVLAPLSRRERNLFRRDMVAAGAVNPAQGQLFDAMRHALRAFEPTNLDELLAVVDAAEATPPGEELSPEMRESLMPIETACMSWPGYASLVAAREFWWSTMPTVILSLSLRGWDGPGLPEFRRAYDGVPTELIDGIPEADLGALGGRAFALAFLAADPTAEKN